MTVKGGTSQACAACKYQRRKCSADCPLAPYFPPDQPKQFQNAHKLFGVSNILKILKNLDPSQKNEAMRSILCQANIRDRYPVHGCAGVIHSLQVQIQQAQQELEIINAHLAMFRQQHHLESSPPPPPLQALLPSSQLQLGTPSAPDTLALFQPQQSHNETMAMGIPAGQDPCYVYNNNVVTANGGNNGNNVAMNVIWGTQPTLCHENPMSNGVQMQGQFVGPNEYDVISPYLDNIEDRQSYIDSKEAYESSPESSLKESTQALERVAENELKSAAARFSLTNDNS